MKLSDEIFWALVSLMKTSFQRLRVAAVAVEVEAAATVVDVEALKKKQS